MTAEFETGGEEGGRSGQDKAGVIVGYSWPAAAAGSSSGEYRTGQFHAAAVASESSPGSSLRCEGVKVSEAVGSTTQEDHGEHAYEDEELYLPVLITHLMDEQRAQQSSDHRKDGRVNYIEHYDASPSSDTSAFARLVWYGWWCYTLAAWLFFFTAEGEQ